MSTSAPTSESCASLSAGRADSAILFLRLFIGTLLFTQAITKSQQYLWLEGEYPSLWGLSGADVVSFVGVLEAVAGAPKPAVLPAAALAASSALSLAFCCRYCRV